MVQMKANIFWLSVLVNILPYYGWLNDWRTLMVRLCSKTEKIWRKDEPNFERIGKQFKKKILVNADDVMEKIGNPKNRDYFRYEFEWWFKDEAKILKKILKYSENMNLDQCLILNWKDPFEYKYSLIFKDWNDNDSEIKPSLVLNIKNNQSIYWYRNISYRIMEALYKKLKIKITKKEDRLKLSVFENSYLIISLSALSPKIESSEEFLLKYLSATKLYIDNDIWNYYYKQCIGMLYKSDSKINKIVFKSLCLSKDWLGMSLLLNAKPNVAFEVAQTDSKVLK